MLNSYGSEATDISNPRKHAPTQAQRLGCHDARYVHLQISSNPPRTPWTPITPPSYGTAQKTTFAKMTLAGLSAIINSTQQPTRYHLHKTPTTKLPLIKLTLRSKSITNNTKKKPLRILGGLGRVAFSARLS